MFLGVLCLELNKFFLWEEGFCAGIFLKKVAQNKFFKFNNKSKDSYVSNFLHVVTASSFKFVDLFIEMILQIINVNSGTKYSAINLWIVDSL